MRTTPRSLNARLRDNLTTVGYSNALGAGLWHYGRWVLKTFSHVLTDGEQRGELDRLLRLNRRIEWGRLSADDVIEVGLLAAFVPASSPGFMIAQEVHTGHYVP